jgi:transposase
VHQVEDWAEVHRLFHREAASKAAIARRLGMSRNTVERLLSLREPPRYARAPASSQLDPFAERIRGLLAADRRLGRRSSANASGRRESGFSSELESSNERLVPAIEIVENPLELSLATRYIPVPATRYRSS